MNGARDDAVTLQLSQLLREHFLRDTEDGSLQIGKPQGLSTKEMEEN
jgi:hypothetical protein